MTRDDEKSQSVELPIACLLTDENKKSRRATVVEPLFNGHQEVRPLADGYAVRFNGDSDTAGQLLDFITGERACCPFFAFDLVFEPGNGPIWLHLRGPEGAKEFVAALLTDFTDPA